MVSYAFCCETCRGTDPHWRIDRSGDAAVSWACDDHLASVMTGMQREDEVTELTVRDNRKLIAVVAAAERIASQDPMAGWRMGLPGR